MNKPLCVIFITVGLDAVGVGLILPILPALLRELTGSDRIAIHYGVVVASYARMQFLFSPVLGRLSDRYGRRPVLLVSLAGGAIDYTITALAPTLLVVLVGRVVAGLTGANMVVATAYIADITPAELRAKRFGLMYACFGLGLIAGPALGGIAGQFSPRYPFLLAAALNGLNFVAAWFVLPESRPKGQARVHGPPSTPLVSLFPVRSMPGILPLLPIYLVMELAGQVPATLWVIHGEDRFNWSVEAVGISLALFGLLRAVSQVLVTGSVIGWLGERRTVAFGVVLDVSGFVILALASRAWVAFAAIPFLCLGRVATPALQSLLTRQIDPVRQGELQGVLVGLSSLIAVVGPLGATLLYSVFSIDRPGLVWLCGAALYLACLPALRHLLRASNGRSLP